MNIIDIGLNIALIIIVIGAVRLAYSYIKKKKKDKKKPISPTIQKPVGSIKTDFNGDAFLEREFYKAMALIKKGNKGLHDRITNKTNKYTVVRGFKVKNGKNSMSTIGHAPIGGNYIVSFGGALTRALNSTAYSNKKTDFYASHIVHEYLHLLGYKHGAGMDRILFSMVKSYGGKVLRKT